MSDYSALAEFFDRHPKLFVLTGAGCSTASGIPDYRDANGDWKRNPPVMYQDFIRETGTRQRYWARSLIGWRRMTSARPNEAHQTLAQLENLGRLELLVTQNVDGLHQAAGSENVVDLHGRIDTIRCLNCNERQPRIEMQNALEALNPQFTQLDAATAPDGDADLEGVDFSKFEIPACALCGGVLKPDVVFFGERVPTERVTVSMTALDRADAMLVVGSSLMVFSGFRFARAMAAHGKPIAVINIGRTRADDILQLKVSASCTEVLPRVAEQMTSSANL